MTNKCAMAIIRTRMKTSHGNVENNFMIYTKAYQRIRPNRFNYNSTYMCEEFEITELQNGDILITLDDKTICSKTKIERTILVKNCYEIEIYNLEGET